MNEFTTALLWVASVLFLIWEIERLWLWWKDVPPEE
jgi:hypothetical protein